MTRWTTSRSAAFEAEIAERVTDAPLIDTVLEPGDALYLPRGTIHSAEALGDTSIHLTVGVHPLTRYQLARFLLDAVQDDPELRASLPMGSDLADPEVLAPHLAATVAALQAALERVPAARIAERLGTNLMQRTRPEPIGPLAQLAAADALASDTRLRRRGARCGCGSVPGDERLKLVLLDRTIELPPGASDAVKLVVDGRAFTPARAARPRTRGAADPDPPAPARGCPGAGVRTSRPPRERCATRADARGDHMLGTAFPAARLLLVEQPFPWGFGGVAHVAASTLRSPLARRGSGQGRRRTRPGHPAVRDARQRAQRRWALVDTRDESRTLRWGTFDEDAELLELPLDGSAGEPDPGPLYLVCTHGKHDPCCALRGRAVTVALAAVRPGQVWQASHLGGCRFAPTVLVLPLGLMYGRVPPSATPELVTAAEADELIGTLLRGRIGMPPAAQAAIGFAHERLELPRCRDVSLVSTTTLDGATVRVRVDSPRGQLDVTVKRERVDATGLTCAVARAELVRRAPSRRDRAGGDPLSANAAGNAGITSAAKRCIEKWCSTRNVEWNPRRSASTLVSMNSRKPRRYRFLGSLAVCVWSLSTKAAWREAASDSGGPIRLSERRAHPAAVPRGGVRGAPA